MLRGFLALAILAALATAACDGSADSESTPVPTPTVVPAACRPGGPIAPGEQHGTLTVDGIERSYVLHIPASYDPASPTPLVIVLHGFTMPAGLMVAMTGMETAAGERGAISVFPQALGEIPLWNWLQWADFPDDAEFLERLVEHLAGELCIDHDQVFAAGLSNGGGMVQRLACDRPDLLAGAGIVAGTYTVCPARVPLIAFHGDADPLVPYEGGSSEAFSTVRFLPVRPSVSEWARGLGCDSLPLITRSGGAIELSTFVNCPAGDGQVQLYTVLGGGHTWPGAAIELPGFITGPTTQEIDATELMLDFFLGPPTGPP